MNNTVDIYLLKYNNFANNIRRRPLTTLIEYQPYAIGRSYQQVFNFNYADGVNTTFVLSEWDELTNGIPDYLLVASGNTILQRWFVIETKYNRNNQYIVTLKRDTIADNWDAIMSAEAYIMRGTVKPDNNLIYNAEPISVNEIKKQEVLLQYQNFKSPWYVAYLANTDGESNSVNYNLSFSTPINKADITVNTISDYENYAYVDKTNIFVGTTRNGSVQKAWFAYVKPSTPNAVLNKYYRTRSDYYTSYFKEYTGLGYPQYQGGTPVISTNEYIVQAEQLYKAKATTTSNTYTSDYLNASISNKCLADYNKIIYVVSENKYYRVQYDQSFLITQDVPVTFGDLEIKLKEMCTSASNLQNSPSKFEVGISVNLYQFTFKLVDATSSVDYTSNFTCSPNDTIDAPYSIIAIPYNDCTIRYGTTNYTNEHAIAQAFMQKLSLNSKCYDIQVVPYMPIDSDTFTQYNTVSIRDGSSIRTFAIVLKNSSFSNTVIAETIARADIKLSNICDKYRLVSPNGVGDFEWSKAKNLFSDTYDFDVTLKPFNPYIKISPHFQGLYGQDFDDFRGLICSGDFSVARVTSQWQEYELANKNYQAIFDRQIETMDFNNNISRVSDVVKSATNALGTGVSTGLATGNVYAAIGATAASAIGGAIDVSINEKVRQRTREDTLKFNELNLGNIKARPNTLSRGSSFNVNNKYFPYVEYYTCTDKEVEIVRERLKYKGMSVGDIATIADYCDSTDEWTYIEATLININIDEDTHTIYDIQEQLEGGIRLDTRIN